MEARFASSVLAQLGLPDIEYPITEDLFDSALNGSGDLPFAHLLHLLQEQSACGEAEWEASEAARSRLAELVAPTDTRTSVSAGGDNWCLEIGPLDLLLPVITIQRATSLIAAAAPCDDGTLRIAAYRPLDARSARLLIGLGLRPHPDDGTVCMRANNWEYALDCAAGTGQIYAASRNEAYLSFWPGGVGRHLTGEVDAYWSLMGEIPARPPIPAVIELGVAYAYDAD